MTRKKQKYILGIDEVGRGCIAGPITFCAFIMKENIKIQNDKNNFKDSKKLTPIKRRTLLTIFNKRKLEGDCDFVIVSHSAKEIEKIGLTKVINKCLERCVTNIIRLNYNLDKSETIIRLDGGLKLTQEFIDKIRLKYNFNLEYETIIKGDEKVEVIANASIVAKVARDNYMINLSKKLYHQKDIYYAFDKNVGYGTALHYKYIQKYGLTEHHRKSWVKKV